MSDDEHIDPSFGKTERLFHYTNSAGLFGILQSNCLWATHYRFLNDSREFYAAQEPLISILSNGIAKAIAAEKVNRGVKFKDGFDLRRVARAEGERLIKEFYDHLLIANPDAIDPFVFSTFSCEKTHPDFENGGLLHWATYGRSGGYAIQINPHKLDKKLKAEGEKYSFAFLSGPAIYDTTRDLSRDFKSASEGIEKFGQSFAQFIISEDRGKEHSIVEMIPHFLTLIAVIKDPYFKSEKEARVVVYRPKKGSDVRPLHAISVRLAGMTPIPYVCLLDGYLLGEDCPIERIIVGPHPDNIRRMFALNTFLRSKKLDEIIQVVESQVPFVGAPF